MSIYTLTVLFTLVTSPAFVFADEIHGIEIKEGVENVSNSYSGESELEKIEIDKPVRPQGIFKDTIEIKDYCGDAEKIDCLDFATLQAIYTLDVFSYYNLERKYDTELKKKAFTKTQEYKDKLKELKEINQKISKSYFFTKFSTFSNCSTQESSYFCIYNYDLRKSGIKIMLPIQISFNSRNFYFDGYYHNTKIIFPLFPTEGKCYNYSPNLAYIKIIRNSCQGETLFLQMSEDSGLAIENALSEHKLVIYITFQLVDIKPCTVKVEWAFWENTYKTKPVLIGKLIKLIMANEESGEVYFEKIFGK